jgi:hypothetical protein
VFRVHVAALGPRPPTPPGLDRLPGPGEVAVSPALRAALAEAAPDELAARFPGTVVATIGADGLASPDELVAVVGASPDELRALGAVEVHGIATAGAPQVTGFLAVLLLIAAIGLLVPVVVFVAMATRISAARREQRYAALRLAGATSAQVGWMASAEAGLAAVAGVALGWIGYAAARPVVAARITFDGLRFVPSDVSVPAAQVAFVALGVPTLVVISAIVVLRRVRLSPLGITRMTRRRPPGAWRVAVPLLGLLGFVLLVVLRTTGAVGTDGTAVLVLAGTSLLATLLGLVVAGPWTTMLAARVLVRLSNRAVTLLAARRMAADPNTTFRAISGVVLAAFVTSMFSGVARDPGGKNLENAQLRPGVVEILTEGQPDGPAAALVPALTADTATVRDVLVVPASSAPGTLAIDCPHLATVVNLDCSGSPSFAGLPPPGLYGVTVLAPGRAAGSVHAIYVRTDGFAAEDRVRTLVARSLPGAVTSTRADQVELDTRQLRELDRGLRIALLFVLVVAACSLTVAAAAGIAERRRPFALLRAAGVHVAELRTTVLLESAAPLAVTLIVGVVAGLAAGAAITTASGQHWLPPSPGFLLTLALELGLAAALTTLPLPLTARLTAQEMIRYE